MEIFALIPARGGSKGIPRKNVKHLAGKPLIAWTIEAARAVKALDHVLVSTDDHEVADVARRYGADVPFLRPSHLAGDSAGSLDVVTHALEWVNMTLNAQPRLVLLLQPTSPLRLPADIEAAIKMQLKTDADSVVGVCPVEHPVAWTMEINELGRLSRLSGESLPARRQDAKSHYQINGALYLTKTSTLLGERTFLPRNTLAYVMPPERSLDIDTPWDFYLADLILKDKNG